MQIWSHILLIHIVIIFRKAIIKGRQTENFTLTFTSSVNGPYNATLIAEPRAPNSHSEQNLQDLVVSIEAFSIQPSLHVDKALQLDGSQTINFEKWSFMDSQKDVRTICLVNRFRTNLIFTILLEGPFQIISKYTNSPLKYELASSNQSFNLAENTNLELKIAFLAPKANDSNLWPLAQRMYKSGLLTINFSNGDSQTFNLRSELIRPILSINHVGIEGKEPNVDARDFGLVHIQNTQTISLYLINKTKVPGKWKLLYVKFPNKNLIGYATKTKLEFENEAKTDDPTVFEFSKTDGILNGPSIPLNYVPLGKAMPSEYINETNNINNINPECILINFRVF